MSEGLITRRAAGGIMNKDTMPWQSFKLEILQTSCTTAYADFVVNFDSINEINSRAEAWSANENKCTKIIITYQTGHYPNSPQDGSQWVITNASEEHIASTTTHGKTLYLRMFTQNAAGQYNSSPLTASVYLNPNAFPLFNLEVGDTVNVEESETAVPYIIVDKNYRPKQSDTPGIVLMRKDIYIRRALNSGGQNEYSNGATDTYLNSTFLSLLSSIEPSLMTAHIPLTGGGTHQQSLGSVKVFLPSLIELGKEDSVRDGVPFEYFYGAPDSKRITDYSSSLDISYWTRTPDTTVSNQSYFVTITGGFSKQTVSRACGLRPCILVPQGTAVGIGNTLIG